MNLPPPPPLVDFVADRFKALGDPTRVRILDLLRARERSVGDLVEELEMSQQNVSKHVNALHREGVLGRRKQGNRAIYSIEPDSRAA